MKKRLISMILSAALLATSVPVTAFAEDANTQNPVVHSEEGTSQGSNVRKESHHFSSTFRIFQLDSGYLQ